MTKRLIIWILGAYRVIDGCPESGNSGPAGISSFEFLLFYIWLKLNYYYFVRINLEEVQSY